MLVASAVVVFGMVAWIFWAMAPSDTLRFGFEQIIHARVPWFVLLPMWGGLALGIGSLVRRRPWFAWPVVGVEALLVGLVSVYILQLSQLPPSTLQVAVGDPFPAYSLLDQDEIRHARTEGETRPPELYIFYRGDW
ncbi:MAG: hypothetical protein AAF430_11965 [Myxococcota bacterium]